MKTTMDELFSELNKDNAQINMSMPGADLNQVAATMDQKLNEIMDKIEGSKAPQQPQEAPGSEGKATEGNNSSNESKEPQKPAEGATEGTEGGGEEGKE